MHRPSQERGRNVDRGTYRPDIQPRKATPERRRCKEKRKATLDASPAQDAARLRAVRDPVHVRTQLAQEPGGPGVARRGWRGGPRREVQGHTPTMNGPGQSDRSAVRTFRFQVGRLWYRTLRATRAAQAAQLGPDAAAHLALAVPCAHSSSLSPEATAPCHLRQEPSAVIPLTGICGEGYEQSSVPTPTRTNPPIGPKE
jgi:hypothetical protein